MFNSLQVKGRPTSQRAQGLYVLIYMLHACLMHVVHAQAVYTHLYVRQCESLGMLSDWTQEGSATSFKHSESN